MQKNLLNLNVDFKRPYQIADGIYWVGSFTSSDLDCNPYLIVDNDEAVLLDGGSRKDFAEVVVKIMQTGISLNNIKALIYQHYDPDITASLKNMEDIISSETLQIISDSESIALLKHYSPESEMLPLERVGYKYEFRSGRKLLFINTPYSHSPGSFVTYDTKTKTLFSSDLFGMYERGNELFAEVNDRCYKCKRTKDCFSHRKNCPVDEMERFHRVIMTSGAALKYSIQQIAILDMEMIAPQHGSILYERGQIDFFIKILFELQDVGIDKYLHKTKKGETQCI